MFKRKTGVWDFVTVVVLSVGCLVFAHGAWAEEGTRRSDTRTNRADEYERMLRIEGCDQKSEPEKTSCRNRVRGLVFGGSGSSACGTAAQNFQTALGSFNSACSKARLTSGGVSCLRMVRRCTDCLNETSDSEDFGSEGCGDLSVNEDDDEEDNVDIDEFDSMLRRNLNANVLAGQAGARRQSVVPNMNESRRRFSICPALAADDLEGYVKEVETSEDRKRKLERDLLEEQEKLAQMQSDHEQQLETRRQQALEIRQKLRRDIDRLTENMDKTVQETINQINEKAREIEEAEASQFDTQIQIDDVFRTEREEIAQAEQACHAAAMARVAKMREEQAKALQESRYSAGGFNNLMRSVGLSDRDRAVQLVRRFTRDCKNDPDFARRMESIRRKRESALQRAQGVLRRLERVISRAETRIAQLRNRLPDEQKRISDQIQQLIDEAQEAQNSLERQVQNLVRTQNNKMQAAQRRIQSMQEQLATQTDYLDQRQRFLALRRDRARGVSSPAGSSDEAFAKGLEVISAARGLETVCQCSCGDGESALDEGKAACERARPVLSDADPSRCNGSGSQRRQSPGPARVTEET